MKPSHKPIVDHAPHGSAGANRRHSSTERQNRETDYLVGVLERNQGAVLGNRAPTAFDIGLERGPRVLQDDRRRGRVRPRCERGFDFRDAVAGQERRRSAHVSVHENRHLLVRITPSPAGLPHDLRPGLRDSRGTIGCRLEPQRATACGARSPRGRGTRRAIAPEPEPRRRRSTYWHRSPAGVERTRCPSERPRISRIPSRRSADQQTLDRGTPALLLRWRNCTCPPTKSVCPSSVPPSSQTSTVSPSRPVKSSRIASVVTVKIRWPDGLDPGGPLRDDAGMDHTFGQRDQLRIRLKKDG